MKYEWLLFDLDNTLLDFDLSNPLYADYSSYSNANYNVATLNGSTFTCHTVNDADISVGSNNLWTEVAQASYGFIIPNTRTYVTVGSMGGHTSAIGYKAEQDNGNCCGGPCAYQSDDYVNYYWLWDVQDLQDVKDGLQNAYDIRPYSYGEFDVPFQYDVFRNTDEFHPVLGGDYDAESGLLYLTIYDGAGGQYSRNPVIAAYKVIYEEFCDGIDNNANGQIDEHLANTWIGPSNGNWYDSPSNWSLNHYPNTCNHVIIGNSSSVQVLGGETAFGYTLTVEQGSAVNVHASGLLSIEKED